MKDLLFKASVSGVTAFAVLSGMRWVRLDQTLLFALVPLAPWMFLLGCVVLAGFYRRWAPFVVAILGLFAVVLVMPGSLPPRSGCTTLLGTAASPETTASPETAASNVVVYSHNVLFGLADPGLVSDQAISSGADIIVLQEAVPEFVERITPFLSAYDHVIQDGNQVVLSKWDISSPQRLLFETPTHGILQATVKTPAGDLLLANVHATPPHVPGGRELQLEQFEHLTGLVGEPQEVPVIAIGDFNATNSDGKYRAISSSETAVDAHGLTGCGFAVTWSPRPGVGPALLGIDHAIVSGAEVEAFAVHDYQGSDHKGIAVRVAFTR